MTDQELLQAIRAIVKEETSDITEIKQEITEIKQEITEIKQTVRKNTTIIEHQIMPAIQKLAEGHETILERMDNKIERRTEQLQDQLDVHQAAIMRINREMQELKQAQ